MNKYEIMLVVKRTVPETAKEEIKNKISSKISALQGKVVSFGVWKDPVRLSFPLQTSGAGREKYHEAAYWLLVCELPPARIGELKEVIRLEENILRNLILQAAK